MNHEGPKTGTIRELAKTLNLSAGTVSRALSGRGDIAQQTRDQVVEAAAKLDYIPKRRNKDVKGLNRVGVCVGNRCVTADGIPDPTYVGLNLLIGLEQAASVANVGLMVGFIDASLPEQKFDHLPVLQRGESQGLILVYPFPESVVKQLALDMPVVSIEHVYPPVSLDTVGPAHSLDAMSAVEHLHRLGHRRIAYVSDDEAVGHKLTLGLRHAGYASGLTRCGLKYRADDVVNVFDRIVEKPQLADFIADRVRDGVTAVITSIDRHGYLLWEQLPARGLRVPQDVSLVGIGGIYRSKGLPQLTTWRCDYDKIAAAALEALECRRSGRRSTDLYQEIASVFVSGESSSESRNK